MIRLFLPALFILLISCNRDRGCTCDHIQTVSCTKKKTGIIFEGYTRQETDTVVVTTYLNDGTFSYVLDSNMYTSGNYDTLVASDRDYDIYLPGGNKHYRISSIVQPADSVVSIKSCAGSCKPIDIPIDCSYSASSGMVDGVIVQPVNINGVTGFKLVK